MQAENLIRCCGNVPSMNSALFVLWITYRTMDKNISSRARYSLSEKTKTNTKKPKVSPNSMCIYHAYMSEVREQADWHCNRD